MTAEVIPIERYREAPAGTAHGVGQGVNAHEWADAIHRGVLEQGVEVRFHPSLPPHTQRLLATLGAVVRFDTSEPPHPLCERCVLGEH